MIKMNRLSEERRRFITILIATLIIFSAVAYISTTPRPREQFLQLYVLGETGIAERYYPGDDSGIALDSRVRWYPGVTNFMSEPQLVLLKVKLGNSTSKAPDDMSATPAPLPSIAEFRRILLNNETWEFPLTWTIVEAKAVGDTVYLTLSMDEAGTVTVSDVGAVKGRNFRMIIELWTLDTESGSYIFGWKADGERRAAWLQIWFNATTAQP